MDSHFLSLLEAARVEADVIEKLKGEDILSLDDLKDVSEEELEKVGIVKLGQRKKLIRVQKGEVSAPPTSAAVAATPAAAPTTAAIPAFNVVPPADVFVSPQTAAVAQPAPAPISGNTLPPATEASGWANYTAKQGYGMNYSSAGYNAVPAYTSTTPNPLEGFVELNTTYSSSVGVVGGSAQRQDDRSHVLGDPLPVIASTSAVPVHLTAASAPTAAADATPQNKTSEDAKRPPAAEDLRRQRVAATYHCTECGSRHQRGEQCPTKRSGASTKGSKAELCRNFEAGHCRRSSYCPFAHGRGELRQMPEKGSRGSNASKQVSQREQRGKREEDSKPHGGPERRSADLGEKKDFEAEAQKVLKNGTWKPQVDPKSGKTYYYNIQTRATVWDLAAELRTRARPPTAQEEPPRAASPSPARAGEPTVASPAVATDGRKRGRSASA